MSAAELLSRLVGVKKSGDGWRSPCPAHGGTNPYALSIREKADGMVLVRCWSHGCTVHEIAQAVGIELHELFPAKPSNDHFVRGERATYIGADVLRALASEIILIVLEGGRTARGEALSEDERKRTLLAAQRVLGALDAAIPARDRRDEYRRAVRIANEDFAGVES